MMNIILTLSITIKIRIMNKIIYILVLLLSSSELLNGQVPIPAKDQDKPIIVMNATAHLGNGSVIDKSAIAFENGKLTIVADASTISVDMSKYDVIDASGQHVYPGFILPNSQLGLVEVNAVRATNDQSEDGSINPNVRSIIAYNTDSENIPTMRFNGILLTETTPVGGTISGTSSVMELEGWNWEDAAHSTDIAMHLNWPGKTRRRFDFNTFTVSENPNKNYSKDVGALKKHFEDAKSYGQLTDRAANLKLEKMQGLFDGSMTLMIHASGPKEIIEAVNLAKAQGVQKMAVVAGTPALYISAFLRDNNIGVIIPPVHSLPTRPDQDIDLPYRLPHLLTEEGVTVGLSHSGMLANARNLPFYAGTAVAYGMNKEDALKTITSNTAEILGISDRVGTLTVGKDATLFISEGDALDIRSSVLSDAFISGKRITLDNKQQALYKRYSDKYGH